MLNNDLLSNLNITMFSLLGLLLWLVGCLSVCFLFLSSLLGSFFSYGWRVFWGSIITVSTHFFVLFSLVTEVSTKEETPSEMICYYHVSKT